MKMEEQKKNGQNVRMCLQMTWQKYQLLSSEMDGNDNKLKATITHEGR